jgi:Negative regulator of sigma F
MRDTDKLIEELSRDAAPVKPLASPLARAGLLLAGLIAAMTAFAAFSGHVEETIAHLAANARFALELAGALTAGIAAIVAAVMLSIPGRAQSWAYLPLPGIALWLIGGGLECYRQVDELSYVPVSMFASKDCFLFIVSVGLPTAAATYLFLRRHLSVDAVRVIALATLGAALLAATLLQFIHAHGTNPVDFATHIVAVTLLTLTAAVARLEFRRR